MMTALALRHCSNFFLFYYVIIILYYYNVLNIILFKTL